MSNQLLNGQGRDINVPAGQTLAVSSFSGSYTALIIAGAGTGTALATDSIYDGTYGPYAGGVTIKLSAGVGALIDYDVAIVPTLTYSGNARFVNRPDGSVYLDLDGDLYGLTPVDQTQTPNYRASVTADCTVWAGPATLISVDCLTAGTMGGLYDATGGTGTVLRTSITGADTTSYEATISDAALAIHADWTSGTWEVVFTAPRQIYTIQPYNGWRTLLSDGSSSFTANDGSKRRQQVFAGPNSVGIVDQSSGAGLPLSVQFGTGATDAVANTAFTALAPNTTSSGMEPGGSSAAPCLVEVDSSGNQSMGYGRVRWNKATGQLRLMQKADDALISSYPRIQLYSRPMLNRTAMYYIHLDFQLGDAETPWPPFVATKNTTLISQIKGGASFPVFDVQVRDAASGDTSKRDLYFLRRLANTGSGSGGFDNQGQNRVLIVSDISLATRYKFGIEVRLSWLDADGYLRIYKDGVPMKLHGDVGGDTFYAQRTIYSATPDVMSVMWGLYRLGYNSVKAPNDCALVMHRAEVETMVEAK